MHILKVTPYIESGLNQLRSIFCTFFSLQPIAPGLLPIKEQQKRLIEQYQFLKWPDFGNPEDCEVLIKFLAMVRSYYPYDVTADAPIVVHCSAGCGRTGRNFII